MKARVEALEARIAVLEAALATKAAKKGERSYGPKSERKCAGRLAIAVAIRLKRGESVKNIADKYGLSRGQVYSLKGGYTNTAALAAVDLQRSRKA